MYKYVYFYLQTLQHKARVFMYLCRFSVILLWRGFVHDNSKLLSSECYWYGKHITLFNTAKYGTKEYDEVLSKFQHAINHHYQLNSHHPEHHPNGYSDMTLVDLVEMFYDWKAASKKKIGTGNLQESIEINRVRFKMSPDIAKIYRNSL